MGFVQNVFIYSFSGLALGGKKFMKADGAQLYV